MVDVLFFRIVFVSKTKPKQQKGTKHEKILLLHLRVDAVRRTRLLQETRA
jgi:hypothetical protein